MANQVKIHIDKDHIATEMAYRVVAEHLPGWIRLFLKKNRKYRKVDDHLGARGVFPDVNRKVGILEARIWDGDEPQDGSESTTEVIDDLIGHLFIMRDMLVQDGIKDDGMKFGEPEQDDDDGPLLPPTTSRIPIGDGKPPTNRRIDPGGDTPYIINMGCHPACKVPVGTHHWHEEGNLDIVHPGSRPVTLQAGRDYKLGEAADRLSRGAHGWVEPC